MVPKKDLAVKKALVEKEVGKRKRPAIVVEEREFRRLRRGTPTTKEVQAPVVERVGEGFPDLTAKM